MQRDDDVNLLGIVESFDAYATPFATPLVTGCTRRIPEFSNIRHRDVTQTVRKVTRSLGVSFPESRYTRSVRMLSDLYGAVVQRTEAQRFRSIGHPLQCAL